MLYLTAKPSWTDELVYIVGFIRKEKPGLTGLHSGDVTVMAIYVDSRGKLGHSDISRLDVVMESPTPEVSCKSPGPPL